MVVCALVTISHIADSEMMPKQFLEGILLRLKNLSFVDSPRGETGRLPAGEGARASIYFGDQYDFRRIAWHVGMRM